MRRRQRLLLGLAGLALIACGIGWTCSCPDEAHSKWTPTLDDIP